MIGSNPMHVDMYSLEVANIPNFIQFRNQTCAPRQKRDHIWQVKGATQSLAAWCFDLRSWCFLLTMQGTRWKKGTREIHWIWLFSAFRKVCKSPLGRAGKIEIAVQSRKITLGKSIRRTPNFQELVMFAMYQGNFFASILIRSAFQIGKARSDRSKKKAPTPRAHGWELAACQLPFVLYGSVWTESMEALKEEPSPIGIQLDTFQDGVLFLSMNHELYCLITFGNPAAIHVARVCASFDQAQRFNVFI